MFHHAAMVKAYPMNSSKLPATGYKIAQQGDECSCPCSTLCSCIWVQVSLRIAPLVSTLFCSAKVKVPDCEYSHSKCSGQGARLGIQPQQMLRSRCLADHSPQQVQQVTAIVLHTVSPPLQLVLNSSR